MDFTGTIKYSFTNDYMFKAVLQQNPDVLKSLLASLLNIPINEIIDVHIENPIILGENIDNKTIVLDVLVTLNDNQRINIEMQVVAQTFWKERSIAYLCRLYNQLEPGDEYTEVMQTIHIGILDFELFPGEKLFYSQNVFMDKNTYRIYSDNPALNVLCLKHIEEATQRDRDCGLYRWAKLFAATTWEELKMIAKNNDIMEAAVATIQTLTEDQKVRIQCEARKRNEWSWKMAQRQIAEAKKEAEDAKRDLQLEREAMRQQLSHERETTKNLQLEMDALKRKLETLSSSPND